MKTKPVAPRPKTSKPSPAPAAAKPSTADSQHQLVGSGAGREYGEGNYKAAREYNAGLKQHMQEHDIEKEARDAAPRTPEEGREMEAAESEAASRARVKPGTGKAREGQGGSK